MDCSDENELLLLTGFSSLALLAYKSCPFKNLFFDFAFWILPQYLIIVYPDTKIALIGFFASCINLKSTPSHLKQHSNEFDIPTWLRSNVSLMVAISILAVDFSFYPTRFGKSDYYGYRFMDIGVGSYVYNAGIMTVKFSHLKNLKSILVLSFLGVIRYLCIRAFGLDVNIREYGKYMNFYFVLAICNALYGCIRSRYDFVLGYIVIVAYNYLLKNHGLDRFILSDSPRVGFLEENKEGLFNIFGYLSILLMSNLCGKVYFSRYSWKKKLCNIAFLTSVFYSSYKTNLKCDEPSRRLGNATYVFWILFLHTLHILIYYSLTIFTGSFVNLTQLYTSKNMMINFLLSNILVLLFTKLFDLKNMDHLYGNLLILLYLTISFVCPVLLSEYLFRIKKCVKSG